MSVFRSIIFSAVVVGIIVGAIITVAHQFGTVPLILKAEVYEHSAKPAIEPSAAAHEDASHDHDMAAWKPEDGLPRNLFTGAANILTAIGFSLLLAGIYALRGHPVTWREGVLWGLAGFAIFTVAPSLGLPPELPGVPAAPLGARQMWWIATAAATASGLSLFVFWRSVTATLLGLCLIVSPHLIGAPQLAVTHTDVPDALSHQFVIAVTLTSFVFWVLLGSLTSIVYRRFSVR